MTPARIVPSAYGDVELGVFREVLSIPGRYLNDHCLIRHDGLWHLYGITGSVNDPSKRETAFAHATSPDLERWEIQPDPLRATGVWPENMGIIAPFVIEHHGRFFMYYSGVDQWTIQRLCLATSHDLFTWDRYPANPIIVPSLSWSRWPGYGLPTPQELGLSEPDMGGPGRRNYARQFGGTYGGCRDPHVLQLDDGTFAMYWVSRLQEKFGHNRVCVAASISPDLVHWQEVGPIFDTRAWPFDEEPTLEVESPCVIHKDGLYWLFFKHGWWTHYVSSPSPLDFSGQPVSRLGFVHAAEVFHWCDAWWITHCSGDPAEFRYRVSNRTRGMYLGRLDWPRNGTPRLANL